MNYSIASTLRAARPMLILPAALIAGLSLQAPRALAESLPDAWFAQGHDAQRTGRSTVAGPRALGLKWTYDLGSGSSGAIRSQDNNSPVVAPDGTIIVPTYMDGLVALKPDGSLKWKLPYSFGATIPNAPALSPDGATVYYLDESFSGDYLRSAAVASGAAGWSVLLLPWPAHFSYSSVAVDAAGTVYFAEIGGTANNGHVWAINPNGTVKWMWASTFGSNLGIEAPVGVDAGGNVTFAHNIAGIVSLDSAGNFKWNYPHIGDYGWPAATIGPDGTAYFAGDAYGDSVTEACTALRTDGVVKWIRTDIGGPGLLAGMAISADGATVFTARSGGMLYALDAQTGETVWSNTIAANGDSFGGSPALAANNVIFIMGTDGTVYAADTTNGSFLWSYQVNTPAFYWGPQSPALGPDGTLYVLAPGTVPASGGLPAKLYAFSQPIAPEVALDPGSLTFATQVVNTLSHGQVVTLSNTGNAPLTISAIVPSPRFGQTNTCGGSVAAGTQCTITVYFRPAGRGVVTGGVTITDNAAGSPHTVALTGTGTIVSLSAATIGLGRVKVGATSAPSSLTLTNKGGGPLTIAAITIAGANATDFAQTNSCPLAPNTLGAGLSCTIQVTFKPTAAGARRATLAFSDNGGGAPQKVTLGGTGT